MQVKLEHVKHQDTYIHGVEIFMNMPDILTMSFLVATTETQGEGKILLS